MHDASKDYKGRTYDRKNDRELMIRFLEMRVRGGECTQAVFEFRALGLLDAHLDFGATFSLGTTWAQAKEEYPTFDDILFLIGGLKEFDGMGVPANFKVIRQEGNNDLYQLPF